MGAAVPETGCGVFSFCREQVGFNGEKSNKTEEEKRLTGIKRAVDTMTHEISHMFGLEHCIYYECEMNGTSGPGDGIPVKNPTLCSVCLLKLKLNIKFDTKERYLKLAEAC